MNKFNIATRQNRSADTSITLDKPAKILRKFVVPPNSKTVRRLFVVTHPSQLFLIAATGFKHRKLDHLQPISIKSSQVLAQKDFLSRRWRVQNVLSVRL